MEEQAAGVKKSFDPADYPALRDVLPAYLHQDFAQEYGSACAAVKAFVSEASGDEILQVKEEWKLFRGRFGSGALEQMQAALKLLGSAWLPTSEAELKEVDEILGTAEAD